MACRLKTKCGRSANKFCKLQIRKFANLNNLLHLRTFRNCGTLRICDLWPNLFYLFTDLNLPQVRKYIIFLLTNIDIMIWFKFVHKKTCTKTTFKAVLIHSCAEFCSLRISDLRIYHKTCRFVICGLAQLRNSQTCHSGMSPSFCGFANCGLLKNVCFPISAKDIRKCSLFYSDCSGISRTPLGSPPSSRCCRAPSPSSRGGRGHLSNVYFGHVSLSQNL